MLSLNISPWELLRWFRRPQLWATSDWQLHHDNVPTHASCLMQNFLVRHQITQVTQPHYSPDLAHCNFWLFPKLKSPLKENRFQTIGEIKENMMGQLMVIGRTVWGPKVPTLKATEASLFYIQCFLYLVSSSINVCIFHFPWLDTFCTDLVYLEKFISWMTWDFSFQQNHVSHIFANEFTGHSIPLTFFFSSGLWDYAIFF